MQRSTFETNGQYITHIGSDPFTGEAFKRCYWCPTAGGYVRLDTTDDESRPGTLGSQPTYSDGSTWRARDVAHMGQIIRAEWRREKACAKAL